MIESLHYSLLGSEVRCFNDSSIKFSIFKVITLLVRLETMRYFSILVERLIFYGIPTLVGY